MRRAVFAVLGTAAATSLLVGLKAKAGPQELAQAVAQEQSSAQSPAASSAGVPQAGAPPVSSPPVNAPPAGASTPPLAQAVPPAQESARKIRGNTVATPYGAVTVTITVAGTNITDIAAQLPTGSQSATVATNAGPKLRQQALARQNADLDTISGATYTSNAYRKSLQSALDQR